MRSFLFICGLTLVVAFATWAYRVNYSTQGAMDRVVELQQQIAHEHETIAVLRAEWAYLNRPERLLALSETYFPELRLMPLHPDHFADPMRVAYPEPEDPLLSNLIAAAVAEVIEGGIE